MLGGHFNRGIRRVGHDHDTGAQMDTHAIISPAQIVHIGEGTGPHGTLNTNSQRPSQHVSFKARIVARLPFHMWPTGGFEVAATGQPVERCVGRARK